MRLLGWSTGGMPTEQCAAPLTPATVVVAPTPTIPGPPTMVISAEKVPSEAVEVATDTGPPLPPLGVATMVTSRPPTGGVTKPEALITSIELS